MSWKIDNQFPDAIELKNPTTYHRIGEGIARGKREYVMSRSELVKFAACPEKWVRGIPDERTRSLAFGDLFDTLLVGNGSFGERFEILPETYANETLVCPQCESEGTGKTCRPCKMERTIKVAELPWNANATACKTILQRIEKDGKNPVKKVEVLCARKAIEILKESQDGVMWQMLGISKHQVLVRALWVDEARDVKVPFKICLDVLPDPKDSRFGSSLADVKTAESAELHKWTRHVWNYKYHVQAALYMDVVNAVLGTDYFEFVHFIIENTAPWVSTYRYLSPEFVELGRREYRAALERYVHCIVTREFPGYDTEDTMPEPWMLRE